MLTAIVVADRRAAQGSAYVKFAHPASRYAVIGAAALRSVRAARARRRASRSAGCCRMRVRAAAVEQALDRQARSTPRRSRRPPTQVASDLGGDVLGDIYASAAYRAAHGAGLRQARARGGRRARRATAVSRRPLGVPASVDALQRRWPAERTSPTARSRVPIYLALKLQRPLFLEGEAGVGKTEVAKVLAAALDTELIRLQCYEGLDVSHAVYEWNYPRQLLEIRLLEADRELDRASGHARAVHRGVPHQAAAAARARATRGGAARCCSSTRSIAPTRSSKATCSSCSSDFQMTIPELGTIRAAEPPVVIITSNRTREVHDALKRRCLYAGSTYPDFEKELRIVTTKSAAALGAARRAGDRVRPGAAHGGPVQGAPASPRRSTGWRRSWRSIRDELDAETIDETLGLLLKNQEDIDSVRGERLDADARARAAAAAVMSAESLPVSGRSLDNVAVFGRILRGAGLDVDHGRMIDAVRTLEIVGHRPILDYRNFTGDYASRAIYRPHGLQE